MAGARDKAREDPDRGERHREAQPDPYTGQNQPFPEDQAQDVSPVGAERHSHADLADSLRDGVRNKAVEAGAREHQANGYAWLRPFLQPVMMAWALYAGEVWPRHQLDSDTSRE